MAVTISEISDQDLEAVSEFLHRHMNSAIPVDVWLASLRPPWDFQGPHHGYQLRDDGVLVGVYTAIFSERPIRGEPEKFCNLATWYVLPDYRFHSLGLLKRLLDQGRYHMTDLSPKPAIIKIMRRLQFKFLDTSLTIMPNVAWPGWSSQEKIITESSRIQAVLTEEGRQIYEDHASLGSLQHLAVGHRGDYCHIVYLRQARKRIPCVLVLHIGAPKVLAHCYQTLSRYFLLKERSLFTLFESRFLERRPVLSFEARSPHRNKLFLSESLEAGDIDNLYSELVTLARQWIVERPRKN